MGVAGEDGGDIFQGGEGVQFLHKSKLKPEIFNGKFLFKFLCQFKLRV